MSGVCNWNMMIEISKIVKAQVYSSVSELQENEQKLIMMAREAAGKAYAPYSKYHVGAALLLANGIFVTGNNQENAAYPSGLCAERTALFYAASQYPGIPVIAMAITTNPDRTPREEFAKPCGSCRQVIAEYEDLSQNPIRIILDGLKIMVMDGIDNLLPFRFDKTSLL